MELVGVALLLIASVEFDRGSTGAGVGLLAGGVVAGYLGLRVLPWPVLRGSLRDALRKDSAPFSGVSLRERLVVFLLDMVLYFLLILIVGYVWAVVVSTGVYALWVWLANRSGR